MSNMSFTANDDSASSRVQVSAIDGMQVGYIRKLMNVLRKQAQRNGGRCDPNFRLTEEYTAGEFAIDYLIGNYERRTNKQKLKRKNALISTND